MLATSTKKSNENKSNEPIKKETKKKETKKKETKRKEIKEIEKRKSKQSNVTSIQYWQQKKWILQWEESISFASFPPISLADFECMKRNKKNKGKGQ